MRGRWAAVRPRAVPVSPRPPAARLGASISSAGLEHREPPTPYRRDGTARGPVPFAQLQLTLDGVGEVESGGRRWSVGPGEAMAASFPSEIRYGRARGRPWRYLYACVYGDEALRLWAEAIRRGGPVWRLGPSDPLVKRLEAVCRKGLAGHLNDAFEASELAYGLASAALRHALGPAAGGGVGRSAEAVARAVALASTRGAERVGVADLARAAGLSRHHFSRVFKEGTGSSPGAYLAAERLAGAVRLLQTTDLPLKEVAAATGHRDAAYLSRVVKRAHGVTPGQVRRGGAYPPVTRG